MKAPSEGCIGKGWEEKLQGEAREIPIGKEKDNLCSEGD